MTGSVFVCLVYDFRCLVLVLRGASEVEERLRSYVAGAIIPWINPDSPDQVRGAAVHGACAGACGWCRCLTVNGHDRAVAVSVL